MLKWQQKDEQVAELCQVITNAWMLITRKDRSIMLVDLYIKMYNGYRDTVGVFGDYKLYRRVGLDWGSAIPDEHTPIQVGIAYDEPDDEPEGRVDCFNVYRRSVFFSTNSNLTIECDCYSSPEEYDDLCKCLENDAFELFIDNSGSR